MEPPHGPMLRTVFQIPFKDVKKNLVTQAQLCFLTIPLPPPNFVFLLNKYSDLGTTAPNLC